MSVPETTPPPPPPRARPPLNGWQRVAIIVAMIAAEVGITLHTGSVEHGLAGVAPFLWVLR